MCNKAVLVSGCLFLVLAIAVGCDKKKEIPRETNRGMVTGTVTLDGKPLPGGSIVFVSAKDESYRAKGFIASDGSFTIPNSPTGDVLVAVEAAPQQSPQQPLTPNKNYVPIPLKYLDVKTSGLTATVAKSDSKEDAPKLTFELKSN
jgi:hypothetical protein